MQARIAESIALVTIGDGVIAALFPARHAARWVIGPEPVRRMLSVFVEHPGLMRAVGVAQVVAGIAWAAALPPTPRRPALPHDPGAGLRVRVSRPQ